MSERPAQGKAGRDGRLLHLGKARETACFRGDFSAILPVHIAPAGRPGHTQFDAAAGAPRPSGNG
ncbi:hypothetical protein SS05631_c41150 [Sinorhizobium sp. CCBAU 05631]|nr:hypothetical protein SS05631_c41150 [Sinorhizobium sp. CCBAU 05631]